MEDIATKFVNTMEKLSDIVYDIARITMDTLLGTSPDEIISSALLSLSTSLHEDTEDDLKYQEALNSALRSVVLSAPLLQFMGRFRIASKSSSAVGAFSDRKIRTLANHIKQFDVAVGVAKNSIEAFEEDSKSPTDNAKAFILGIEKALMDIITPVNLAIDAHNAINSDRPKYQVDKIQTFK
jgi:hypothetical protein